MSAPDTIFALSSGRPPAAIAIVRVSGPAALQVAFELGGRTPQPRQAALARLNDQRTGDLLDEALVIFFAGPHSATGEDVVEFHCHGGRATIAAVTSAIGSIDGVREALPGEFTRRALGNGRIDLTEAEGLADLLAAETEIQRKSAMLRAGGALRRTIDACRDEILQLGARAEVAIDYADEEDGSGADAALPGDIEALATRLGVLANAPRVEPLRDGIRVVIAGPPNVGKSSLINALSKSDRAIVTDIPGTTRDVIDVPLAIGGIPFVLVDTAGLRESQDRVEAIGIERARDQVDDADILLWLGDPEAAPDTTNLVKVHPKADIFVPPPDLDAIAVSSVTEEGLDRLVSVLISVAKQMLPVGTDLAVDGRQRMLLEQAYDALSRAAALFDPVLIAEELRVARVALDGISGRAGVDDLLDALFARFCLGK